MWRGGGGALGLLLWAVELCGEGPETLGCDGGCGEFQGAGAEPMLRVGLAGRANSWLFLGF